MKGLRRNPADHSSKNPRPSTRLTGCIALRKKKVEFLDLSQRVSFLRGIISNYRLVGPKLLGIN